MRLGAGLSFLLGLGLAPAAYGGSGASSILIAALAAQALGLARHAAAKPALAALRCTRDGQAQGLKRVPDVGQDRVIHSATGRAGTDLEAWPEGGAVRLDLKVLRITGGLIVLAGPGMRFTLWRDSVPASFYRRLAACGRWSAHRPPVARPTAL